MARGKAHPPEVRARAEALLLAGHTQAQVCIETGLDDGLISRWAAALGPRLQKVAEQKQESDAQLLMSYFRGVLRAMVVQTEIFADPDYCRAQPANALAIAHGVLGDKLAGIATTAKALGILGTETPAPAEAYPAIDVPHRNGTVDPAG